MQKLIEKYKANPNEKTKAALLKYHQKHAFSIMFLTEEQNAILKSLGV